MRPWRFATDNRRYLVMFLHDINRFNEAVAFCHG